MTICTSDPLGFKGIKGHSLENTFREQTITPDGGEMLLRPLRQIPRTALRKRERDYPDRH